MSEPDQRSTSDRLTALLEKANYEETVACLNWLSATDAETRNRAFREVRDVVAERARFFS